ncbi:MAG: hypothetical protein J7L17_00820 [Thaumarchaeota archaeon]|nr:hypothetical protein [Nitrososphaerota archaeon]
MGRRVAVLDSTAFIIGFTEAGGDAVVTSSKVLEEAKWGEAEYRALAGRESGTIKVIDPKPEYLEEVRRAARRLGEFELSETDLSILALALQLSRSGDEAYLVTSDYSIQNLASKLGIRVKPVLHRGIRRVISWEIYCSVCGWVGEGIPGEPCPRCGHRLKRRPRRRT